MKFEFTSPLIKKESSLMWNYRIEVPQDICTKLFPRAYKGAKRVSCKLNDSKTIQIALTPDGNGNFYVIINKETRKVLKIDIGDDVLIEISKDDSKYGIALPIEMEELLAQDEYGSKVFHGLTPGRQRSLLHLVAKPKSEAIRIKKAITIIEYLKSVNGKLDFKELNIAFKQSNNSF